jgi:hypothetical protein
LLARLKYVHNVMLARIMAFRVPGLLAPSAVSILVLVNGGVKNLAARHAALAAAGAVMHDATRARAAA